MIPVEITVPLNRVSSLDDIAVEIENFDVDLLSKRSLNITGVLSLKGIQAAAKQTREASWSGEEFTVVHAPDQAEQEAAETYLKLSQFDSEPGSSSAASQPEAGHGEPIHDRVIEAEPAGENRTDQYLASWAEYERQIRLQAEQEGQQIQAGSGGIPAWPEVDQSFEQAAQAQAAQEEEASRAEPFGKPRSQQKLLPRISAMQRSLPYIRRGLPNLKLSRHSRVYGSLSAGLNLSRRRKNKPPFFLA